MKVQGHGKLYFSQVSLDLSFVLRSGGSDLFTRYSWSGFVLSYLTSCESLLIQAECDLSVKSPARGQTLSVGGSLHSCRLSVDSMEPF